MSPAPADLVNAVELAGRAATLERRLGLAQLPRLAEAQALENLALELVGKYEDQRFRTSDIWYRLGGAERTVEVAREAAVAGKKPDAAAAFMPWRWWAAPRAWCRRPTSTSSPKMRWADGSKNAAFSRRTPRR